MKKIMLMFALLTSSSSFAGVFKDLDLDSILNPDGRAETYVKTYNTLNKGKEINELKKGHSSCGEAAVSKSRTNAIKVLEDFYEETRLADALQGLNKAGKITFAILAQDGEDGEPEYCSTATFRFYSTDNEVLELNFDYND